MGLCSPEAINQNNRDTHREYSTKSMLLQFLNQHTQQEWVFHVKEIVSHNAFSSSDRSRYSKRNVSLESRNWDGQQLQLYNRFKSMSPQNKGKELNLMLSKAYMIIDEQDMPHNNSKLLLPELASRNLFTSSLNASTFGSAEDPQITKRRDQRLRAYDPDLLKHLEEFVQFCEDINKLTQTPGSLLFQLVLSFKGCMIQVFKALVQQKSNEGNIQIKKKLVETTNIFIYFIIEVLTTCYDIYRLRELEKDKCFYSQINLYTLVTSLLFKERQFQQIVQKVYNVCMIKQIVSFKHNATSPYQKYPLPVQFSLDKNTLKHLKLTPPGGVEEKPRAGLFNTISTQSEPYYKCLKMLSELSSVKQPIGKLKIIYEVGLRVAKEVEKFYGNYLLPVPKIDGENLLQITKNLLNRCENQNIVVEILIASDFIHSYYLISKKGSYLTPFLVSIDSSQKQ